MFIKRRVSTSACSWSVTQGSTIDISIVEDNGTVVDADTVSADAKSDADAATDTEIDAEGLFDANGICEFIVNDGGTTLLKQPIGLSKLSSGCLGVFGGNFLG